VKEITEDEGFDYHDEKTPFETYQRRQNKKWERNFISSLKLIDFRLAKIVFLFCFSCLSFFTCAM